MKRDAELRAATRLQTADATQLAAAVHWGCDVPLLADRHISCETITRQSMGGHVREEAANQPA
jgi:hypothetical protein